jgi:putative peptidoglycan lipid II flippase
VVGFASQVVIAAVFGTSTQLDVYWVVLAIVSYIPGIFASGIADPLIVSYVSAASAAERERLVSAVFTWNAVLGVLQGLAMVLGAGLLLNLVAAGFSAEQLAAGRLMLLLAVPLPFVLSLFVLVVNLLAAEKHFTWPKAISLLQPLAVVVAVAVAAQRFGVYALVAGTVAGYVLQVAGCWYLLRRAQVRPRLSFELFPPPALALLRNGAPLILATLIGGAMVFSDRNVASLLGAGAIAAIGYADNLQAKLIQVLLLPLSTVVFPYLAEHFNRGQFEGVLTFVLRIVLLLFVPIAVFSAFFAPAIVGVLFQRGAFTTDDANAVAAILRAMMLGLPLYAVAIVVVRSLMLAEITWVTVATSGFGLATKLLLNQAFGNAFGAPGLFLLTSLVYCVTVPFMVAVLVHNVRMATGFLTTIVAQGLLLLVWSLGAGWGVLALLNGALATTETLWRAAVLALALVLYGVVVYGGAALVGVLDVRALRAYLATR